VTRLLYRWFVQIYVVGDNRLRRITRALDNSSVSEIQGILSYNRVETVAGALEGGRVDGNGPVARFEDPKGVMMSPNGRIFVADALQSPSYVIARNITCSTRLVDLIRPSGCTLYDPPVDVFDRLQSPLANHIYYNENLTSSYHIQTCMGTPPPSIGPTSSGVVSSSAFGSGGSSAGGYVLYMMKCLECQGTDCKFSFGVCAGAQLVSLRLMRMNKRTLAQRFECTAHLVVITLPLFPPKLSSQRACLARSTTRTSRGCAHQQAMRAT
jgi:hypothetical protein